MSNLIETIPMIGVRGDVLIETRDAKSGKLAQRSEGHNLFTNHGLERFRKYCAMGIGGQFGCNTYFDENLIEEVYQVSNSVYFGFLNYLYLTDNAETIAATDRLVKGAVTGYASRAIYSGTDVLRGTLNQNETLFMRSGLKAVFDFATDRANGVHKSIFWADDITTSYNKFASLEDSGIQYSFTRIYNRLAESSDGYFYGSSGTTLYKIDPTTLAEIATYTLPATPTYNGMFDVNDGLCIFTTGPSATTLYVFTLADSTSTTKTLPVASSSYCGALVGGVFYYPSGSSKVYAYNISAGTNTSKTPGISGLSPDTIIRCGNALYITKHSADALIFAYDYSANTNTSTGVLRPLGDVDGTTLCNSYSLAGRLWQMRRITSYNGTSPFYKYTLQKLNLSLAPANMITGKLLDTPITKDSTQTMKVTYTISFV